jgi:hypothetical protein
MINIDNTLETFVKADYSVARLMHKLRRLALREYKLGNYGESSKRCISWFKLYSVILPTYIQYPDIFTTNEIIVSGERTDYRFNFTINQLRTSKYDDTLYWYTECRKYLVGPNAYCLIEKINKILPDHEKYEAFMTYSDIVVSDGGLNNTHARYVYMCDTLSILKEAKKFNRMICSDKVLPILNSIIIKPVEVIKKQQVEVEKTDAVEKNKQEKWIKVYPCDIEDTPKPTQTMQPSPKVTMAEKISERLTYDNAHVGMIITYSTKKGIEYAKITKVCKEFVETNRLKKDSDGKYIEHKVPMCKVSQNKPAYTRVITILNE